MIVAEGDKAAQILASEAERREQVNQALGEVGQQPGFGFVPIAPRRLRSRVALDCLPEAQVARGWWCGIMCASERPHAVVGAWKIILLHPNKTTT